MPSTARRSAILLFAAIYAAVVLLAPAPLFHHNCSDLRANVRCHVAGLTSITAPHERVTYDCPACTFSAMSAMSIAALVVVGPGDSTDRPVLAPSPAPRPSAEQSLGSRGPPAA